MSKFEDKARALTHEFRVWYQQMFRQDRRLTDGDLEEKLYDLVAAAFADIARETIEQACEELERRRKEVTMADPQQHEGFQVGMIAAQKFIRKLVNE